MTSFLLSRTVRLVSALLALSAFAIGSSAAGGATGPVYAALGDSYSSGVGTGSYALDSGCKRSASAYPFLWAQKHPGTSLSFVACSGAKTSDLLATQLQALSSATTLVTMTIGGNDIGFSNLIYQCTLSDCSAALDAARAGLDATLDTPLDNVFNAVRAKAPNAKIIVLGYPQVFTGGTCLAALGITAAEQAKANALASALDSVIATRASIDGVAYQSAIPAFTGHAVCSASPWLNGLNLLNTTESYHPNRNGQSSGYLSLLTIGAP
jgi:hypothetical protein